MGDYALIDVPGSFSPRSLSTQIFKFLCLAATIGVAAVLFVRLGGVGQDDDDEKQLHYLFYFYYFTVWGLLLSALYFCTSWANTCIPLKQTNDTATLRTRFTWVIFEVAAHTELTVTTLYWGLLWKPDTGFELGNVMAHGGVMVLVLWTGLVVNRVPVRCSHYIFPFTVDLLYMIWTFVHDYYSLGNGDEEVDDDAIYDVIDWDGNFKKTASTAAMTLGVVSPSLWILLWLASLCGRRYTKLDSNEYSSVAYANSQVGRHRNYV